MGSFWELPPKSEGGDCAPQLSFTEGRGLPLPEAVGAPPPRAPLFTALAVY